ncbi:hypothetical protein [Arthrobacter sp. NEB 688]|uniref:hypothetical protein n=1 Tax=Arthrobacter sp. NEB 688 TaxID=904039 RepID=UPI001562FA11|nr:hypothetical protein [Arthrobacter sp. NEB 688]QKE84354.1 hypothetical protein HL663_10700 [Arthrobacter sp. NEB 688]
MSLSTTIATGTLVGGLLAVGVYAATAPSGQVAASVKVAPSSAPVPTPTVTHLAGCRKPAKLEHGVCVTHVPGPTVTLPAAVPAAAPARTVALRTSAPTTGPTRRPATTQAPTTGPTAADDGDEDEGEDHGDDEHDDEDHGDEDHGGEHDD